MSDISLELASSIAHAKKLLDEEVRSVFSGKTPRYRRGKKRRRALTDRDFRGLLAYVLILDEEWTYRQAANFAEYGVAQEGGVWIRVDYDPDGTEYLRKLWPEELERNPLPPAKLMKRRPMDEIQVDPKSPRLDRADGDNRGRRLVAHACKEFGLAPIPTKRKVSGLVRETKPWILDERGGTLSPMARVRVYSDLNGGMPPPDIRFARLELSYQGSLGDLCRQKVKLQEGMQLTVHCDNDESTDFEIDGIAVYDPTAKGGNHNRWMVEVDMETFREVPADPSKLIAIIPCINCDFDMLASLSLTGITESSLCPKCGTPVYSSFLPPTR